MALGGGGGGDGAAPAPAPAQATGPQPVPDSQFEGPDPADVMVMWVEYTVRTQEFRRVLCATI